jgi:hypothetical protein
MSVASILVGTLVLWAVAFGPVQLGLLSRSGGDAVHPERQHLEFATLLVGSFILATVCILLQKVRGTDTVGEAIAVGLLVGVIPAAVLAGRGMQSGNLWDSFPRIVLFLSGLTLSSIAIVLMRQ